MWVMEELLLGPGSCSPERVACIELSIPDLNLQAGPTSRREAELLVEPPELVEEVFGDRDLREPLSDAHGWLSRSFLKRHIPTMFIYVCYG